MESVGTPALWIGFTVFVLFLLVLDLGVFHRKAHEIRFREALIWTIVWIGLSLTFNLGVYFWFGADRALEFLTGYVIEKSLSVDNIFVFLVLFRHFAVPLRYQHRVLFWGILGALVTRAAFIALGAVLLERFEWVTYVFGLILLVTGLRLLRTQEVEVHPEKSRLFRMLRKLIPATSDFHDGKLIVRENGKWFATPLLFVLATIEGTDVVFAVDSIPAIFAVTRDPFIVYTSNIFAILGLRSLYFLLAGAMDRFRYLNIGLALILLFVGAKMMLASVFHIPIAVSLVVVLVLLGGAIIASALRPLPVNGGGSHEATGPTMES